jgi:hypothetical protein
MEEAHTCIVCNERKQDGIRIWNQFICLSCEREIVQTDVDDDRYAYYIERMKRIWLEAIS